MVPGQYSVCTLSLCHIIHANVQFQLENPESFTDQRRQREVDYVQEKNPKFENPTFFNKLCWLYNLCMKYETRTTQ